MRENDPDGAFVDTLFGPVEAENERPDYQALIQEEMPHYLFGDGDDRKQADLPLVRVPLY